MMKWIRAPSQRGMAGGEERAGEGRTDIEREVWKEGETARKGEKNERGRGDAGEVWRCVGVVMEKGVEWDPHTLKDREYC
jgi:hypothetical protein